jgi:hypothetical protein
MVKKEKYMAWINEFSKSASSVFKGQVLEGFQPLDFYHFFPLWYDLWISNIASVIVKLGIEKNHYDEIKDILPTPSSIRAILGKIIPAYMASRSNNKQDYKMVSNFLARMLKESCPNDPFALKSNPFHSKDEINAILKKVTFKKANVKSARLIGQLITAAGSLVHGLYNDFVTDFGWDIYGPYKLNNEIFLIRHFPNLQPIELWAKNSLPIFKEITIYASYKDVEWKISYVGCHTTSTGQSPVLGMRKFCVYADKKPLDEVEISKLVLMLSEKATDMYKKIKKFDFESLKYLVMKQECYQLKKMFDKARVNWQPTNEMLARIKNKKLLKDVFPHGKMIKNITEFEKIFGINVFNEEVLKSKQ